jgi:hypothetical protein
MVQVSWWEVVVKRGGWWWALLLVFGSLGIAHEAPQTRQQQQPEQRPTLGPAPAPSLRGPRTSTTTDARKLVQIRTIFIERIDNLLSEKLADGLSRTTRFRVVTNRNEADAVLRGTCSEFRRLKSVHSEVYVTDRSGAAVWQDSVRRPFNPPTLEKALNETALVILEHLADSVREADRK